MIFLAFQLVYFRLTHVKVNNVLREQENIGKTMHQTFGTPNIELNSPLLCKMWIFQTPVLTMTVTPWWKKYLRHPPNHPSFPLFPISILIPIFGASPPARGFCYERDSGKGHHCTSWRYRVEDVSHHFLHFRIVFFLEITT